MRLRRAVGILPPSTLHRMARRHAVRAPALELVKPQLTLG